jgi:hypothetical protein
MKRAGGGRAANRAGDCDFQARQPSGPIARCSRSSLGTLGLEHLHCMSALPPSMAIDGSGLIKQGESQEQPGKASWKATVSTLLLPSLLLYDLPRAD